MILEVASVRNSTRPFDFRFDNITRQNRHNRQKSALNTTVVLAGLRRSIPLIDRANFDDFFDRS